MVKKNLTIAVALLGIIVLGAPSVSHAQLDPRCFTEQQCADARKENGIVDPAEQKEGFYKGTDARAICGTNPKEPKEVLGFCLPSTKTVTEISFGGRREFNNIGDFIQLMYRYGIVVGGLLATIIIVLGGIRWTLSGGSAERVKGAQKMIGGAIMGILLLAISWTLLNILNPATVNLRLPQVWMVNRQDIAPTFCNELPKESKLALVTASGAAANSKTEIEKAFKEKSYPPEETDCGKNYYITAQGQTCAGLRCTDTSKTCQPKPDDFNAYTCQTGQIGGIVHNSSITDANNPFSDWTFPWITLWKTSIGGLCQDKPLPFAVRARITSNDNTQKETQRFLITLSNVGPALREQVKDECGSESEFLGFVLIVQMNENLKPTDETHYLGKNAVDIGGADTFIQLQADKALKKETLISLDEMAGTKGLRFNIDVSKIKEDD